MIRISSSHCRALGVVLLAAVLAACGRRAERPVLEIATTTSVQNSGLLDALLPHFADAEVRAHAAGSGRALGMLAEGQVDLVISHAPEAEHARLVEHGDWRYRKIASNRFVIVGPVADPAGIKGNADAVNAFRKIAASTATLVSRGDGSGTHERELRLWQLAGTKPDVSRVIVSGRGMAQALRHADEAGAYTLADEATFWQLDNDIELVILVEGDPRLLNTYAVIHKGAPLAQAFAEWLSRGEGRTRMAAHRVAGRPAFEVWPAGCPDETSAAVPCAAQAR